jgi:KDO2-lipid IV(A) lauroyltransferase
MNAIIYYLFVYPLSKLPLWLTYRFADFFYVLLITILPYRKKVISENLKRCFPNLTDKERKNIRRQFYFSFANMLVEGVKNLGISENELRKRFVITNPEVMSDLYAENKSVLLVSAHFLNWEWMISGMNLFFPQQAVGIGMPLSSGFWDKKINALRSRFGMKIIHSKIVNSSFEAFQQEKLNTATLVLADQSPGDTAKSYWMTFLGQQTAIAFGTEFLANKFNQAVVFYLPKQRKRGYYEVTLELITKNPETLQWGELTEAHVSKLAEHLLVNPAPWLWSHKRWKRTEPTDFELLKNNQREKFNTAFRSN